MAWVNGKSGTYNISTNNAPISGYVYWSERYDIANNKSEISQVAYLHRTNIYDGNTWFENGTVTRTAFFGSETVATTVVTSMTIKGNTSSGGGEYLEVYSAVKEVPHNADGSMSITLGFSMSNNVGGVAGNSFTVPKTTATVSLTTIPRATKPSLSATTVTMGSTINITLSAADSSFKHKIRYEFGSLVSQINGVKSNNNDIVAETFYASGTFTFTPPTSLGSQMPNDLSGTAKLIIYTYESDGTHVGTETANITINVPSYTPSVSCGVSGNNLLNDLYVQGKSTANVVIAAVTSYGASIKSYSTVVDGKTYTERSFTTSVLSSGNKTAVTTVTDTRGKTATCTSSAFTVYEYFTPTITEFSLARQEDNTTVVATVKGSVASINSKNAKTISVTLNGTTKTITSSSYTINGTATFTNVPTDSTLTGSAKITDSYTTVTKDAVLPTVAVTMDFLYDGKGIAVGKVSETTDLLDVAWNERVRKNLTVDGTINGLSIGSGNYVRGGTKSYATDENWVSSDPTFLGTYNLGETWYETISIRHRNGSGDGNKFGMELRSRLIQEDSLSWRQHTNGTWSGWRRFLDIRDSGTWNGWEYTKWSDGTIELFAEKSLSFADGAKQADNLYRSIVQIDLSGILKNIKSGTCCVQINGMVPQVCRHSSTLTLAEIVIVTSRTFTAFTLNNAPIYIIGKWK